jgi:hypothetical protein
VIYPGEEVLGDLLIQGRITRVSGGNRWHRIFFELFGFGATEVKVTGEVIDLYSSTPVLGFGLSRGSGFTWRENEAAVREDLRQIAEEVSRALILQNSLNHQGGQ